MKMRYQKWWLMLLLAIATPLHAALTIEITGGAGNQIPLAIVPFARGKHAAAEHYRHCRRRPGAQRPVQAGGPGERTAAT